MTIYQRQRLVVFFELLLSPSFNLLLIIITRMDIAFADVCLL